MLNNEYYMKIFHEIKNSVALIDGYLQLMEKKLPTVADYDYWATSKNETARLRTIVTELSQLKLGSNLQLEPIDIRDFLASCCNSFQCYAGDETVSCILSIPGYPLWAPIDSKQLRHAMINLLKNSCEAMHHCGNILVDAFLEAEHVSIRITDLGGGIAPDIQEHLFEPFFTTKEDGSGLGLNITKQIISAHNGSISVDSRIGDGCTFTVTLPAIPSVR